MPALSQSFEFPAGANNAPSTSVMYPAGASGEVSYSSTPLKGDGYYGGTQGLHTVTYSPSTLDGTVSIQATLATNPLESDWFDVDGTAYTFSRTDTNTVFSNFTGNFVWVRAKVALTHGTLLGVLYNH